MACLELKKTTGCGARRTKIHSKGAIRSDKPQMIAETLLNRSVHYWVHVHYGRNPCQESHESSHLLHVAPLAPDLEKFHKLSMTPLPQ